MSLTQHQWSLPAQPPAPSAPRDYVRLLRGRQPQWWRGLLAILLGTGIFIGVQVIGGIVLLVVLVSSGTELTDLTNTNELTARVMSNPWAFLINNLMLAALIPAAGLSIWACFRWRPRWVSSVAGRLRWGLMLACAGVATLGYAVYSGISVALDGVPTLIWSDQVVLLLVMVLLTTPLQAAAEEYFFRGLLAQSIGSWFARPVAAFLASGLITGLLFAAVHSLGGAQNFWLFFSRFVIGLVASYLTWRTGGLEAGIALHTVNNVFGLVPAILTGGLGAALANPEQPVGAALVQLIAVVLVAAGMLGVARAMKVRRLHDPAAEPGALMATNCWPQPPHQQAPFQAPRQPMPPGSEFAPPTDPQPPSRGEQA